MLDSIEIVGIFTFYTGMENFEKKWVCNLIMFFFFPVLISKYALGGCLLMIFEICSYVFG